jgi:hypothetical protein
VFLARGPDERADEDLRAFYERLVRAVSDSELRDGKWSLCECTGWPDNDSYRRLVAWCWSGPSARNLVVVNLSAADAQARVHLPWADLEPGSWEFVDRVDDDRRFERSGDEVSAEGLYVGLEPWGWHFLALTSAPASDAVPGQRETALT